MANNKPIGRMEIVDPGMPRASQSDTSSSRPTSSGHKAPSVNGSRSAWSSRPTSSSDRSTPIREATLQSVRRKTDKNSSMDDLACSVAGSSLADDAEDELADLVSLSSGRALSGLGRTSQSDKPTTSYTTPGTSQAGERKVSIDSDTKQAGDQENDTDSDDSSSDEEERKAPTQLIMEFLQCLMDKDTENALKLCKMILIYEPTNSQALKFLPLLQEKKEQDEEAYEGDSSSGEHDSSDEDSEEGSDDEEGDSGSASSSEEEEEAAPSTSLSSPRSMKGNKNWKPTAR